MKGDKKSAKSPPKMVRKSLMIEEEKLARARKVLGTTSDAETLRVALDHLMSHFEGHGPEEE